MEFKGSQSSANANTNRVTSSEQPRPVQMAGMHLQSDGKGKKHFLGALIIAGIIVIGGAGAWWWKVHDNWAVKGAQYQAVFLTNGQVYFCKLGDVTGAYVKCRDIYYLQVQQSVQPAEKDKPADPKVQLAKLGSELHGPEDEMLINRDQVLFWENLKNDSTVVKTIQGNQK